MGQTFSTELAGVDSVPAVKPSSISAYGARLKRFRATIPLASQASGDTVVLADLPAGYAPAFFIVNTSVTLGTSTIALGNASSSTAYSAATTYTAANLPVFAGNAAMQAGGSGSTTVRILATIGVAALPASGTLVIELYAACAN